MSDHITAFLRSMGERDMALEVQNMANRLDAFVDGLDRAAFDIMKGVAEMAISQRDGLAKQMNDLFPVAHRLALELECLLLSCTDAAATAKWWDSANEALEQWREFCREDAGQVEQPEVTSAPAIIFYPAGSLGEEVHS